MAQLYSMSHTNKKIDKSKTAPKPTRKKEKKNGEKSSDNKQIKNNWHFAFQQQCVQLEHPVTVTFCYILLYSVI